MYDMYPEWGPSKHYAPQTSEDPRDRPRGQQALQTALDLRDNGGQRPDDN